ncbi:MAG: phosphate-starvation-inducible PsiE family protein [Syntrophotaleaceae bacterium]
MFFLNIEEMMEVFSFFLMVLIGLELVESLKAYLDHDKVPAEVVVLVALVAVARKVIILDYEKMVPEQLVGIAAILLALSCGFYSLKHIRNKGAAQQLPGSGVTCRSLFGGARHV